MAQETADSQRKPKFAMYWAASCGGCEIAVLNIHEGILDVDANFDVVFWPVAMDAKYKDVEAMEDGSITLCLFNGAIRNERERGDGPPAAPQVQDPGGLRLVRLRGLHPRPGQPLLQTGAAGHRISAPSPPTTRTVIRPQIAYQMPRRRAPHPVPVRDRDDPRPGGAGGLLHARLPARERPDRSRHRAGDQGAEGRGRSCRPPGSVHRRGEQHRVRRMPAQARGEDHQRVPAHGDLPAQPDRLPAGAGHPLLRGWRRAAAVRRAAQAPTCPASAATAPRRTWSTRARA